MAYYFGLGHQIASGLEKVKAAPAGGLRTGLELRGGGG